RQVAVEYIEPAIGVPADDEVPLAVEAAQAAESERGVLVHFLVAGTDELAVERLEEDDVALLGNRGGPGPRQAGRLRRRLRLGPGSGNMNGRRNRAVGLGIEAGALRQAAEGL